MRALFCWRIRRRPASGWREKFFPGDVRTRKRGCAPAASATLPLAQSRAAVERIGCCDRSAGARGGDPARRIFLRRCLRRERTFVDDSNMRSPMSTAIRRAIADRKNSSSSARASTKIRRVDEVGRASAGDVDEPRRGSFSGRTTPRRPPNRKNIFRPFSRGWGAGITSTGRFSQHTVDLFTLHRSSGCGGDARDMKVLRAASGLALRAS